MCIFGKKPKKQQERVSIMADRNEIDLSMFTEGDVRLKVKRIDKNNSETFYVGLDNAQATVTEEELVLFQRNIDIVLTSGRLRMLKT